jgi:hypothetical protein
MKIEQLPAAGLTRQISRIVLICGFVGLVGCVSAPPTIYGWGSYQHQVYEYLKSDGSSPEEQVASLEKDLMEMSAKGEAAPPGFHAHLGLLYASLGKVDNSIEEFQVEKTLFPESAQYVDFLLSNKNKGG